MKTTPFAVKAIFVSALAIAAVAATTGAAQARDADNFGSNPICQEYKVQIRGVLDTSGYHFAIVDSCLPIRSNGADHVFGIYTRENVEGLPDYTTIRYRLGYGADDNS